MKTLQVVILVLFLVSCSANPTTSSTATSYSLSTLATSLASATIPSTQTATNTPALTPLPTWTPFPTFSQDEGMETLSVWLQGTDDCLLPCWAGITPQKTTWDEADQIMQASTSIASIRTFLNRPCPFGTCNYAVWSLISNANTYGSFYSRDFEENKIQSMQLVVDDPRLLNAIPLQRLLGLYGKPALLLLNTDPNQPGQKILELILIYPERQFLIKYSQYAEITGENIRSCGQNNVVELVILNNRYQLESLDAITRAPETERFHIEVGYKSVEEVVEMTIIEFYETYRQANAPCISLPTKIWLP